jgi:hypothetical protein
VAVGMSKKSMPAEPSRWSLRKVFQSGPPRGRTLRWLRMDLATVALSTAKPSMSNSPWIRGAPQVGFSEAMVALMSRRSSAMGGLPGRDLRRQKSRNPAPCQRSTVAGWTKERERRHGCCGPRFAPRIVPRLPPRLPADVTRPHLA